MKKMICVFFVVGLCTMGVGVTTASAAESRKTKPKVTAKQYQHLLNENKAMRQRIKALENTFDTLFYCLNPVWDLGFTFDTVLAPLYGVNYSPFGSGWMLALGIDTQCVTTANDKGTKQFLLPGSVYGG